MEKRKILIVDDEISVRLMIALALKSGDYKIDFAGDGAEALSCMERLEYDLVITDYLMPFMDGLALIEKIRSKWPSTPVMLVTGAIEANRFQKENDVVCIQKPFNVQDLQTNVKEILNGKKS